jgi:hypothetical protein
VNGYLVIGLVVIAGLIITGKMRDGELVPFLIGAGVVAFAVVFVFPHIPALAL